MLALALHMIPTAIVVMVLLISWKMGVGGCNRLLLAWGYLHHHDGETIPAGYLCGSERAGLPHRSSFPLRLDQAARIATATGGFRLKSTGVAVP